MDAKKPDMKKLAAELGSAICYPESTPCPSCGKYGCPVSCKRRKERAYELIRQLPPWVVESLLADINEARTVLLQAIKDAK